MCICFDNVYFRITQCDIYICFNDFDILYIITLSDLFITMIFTYYFLFFQVASATVTSYGLSRGLLGLKWPNKYFWFWFWLLHTPQTHRLRTNSLTTLSSREGINSRCRRFDRSCRRSDCLLVINRDHSMLSPLSSLPFRLVGGDEPWPQLTASLVLFNWPLAWATQC